MDGGRDHRVPGAFGLVVRDARFAGVRLRSAHPDQRRAAARAQGGCDVGWGGRLRALQGSYAGAGAEEAGMRSGCA